MLFCLPLFIVLCSCQGLKVPNDLTLENWEDYVTYSVGYFSFDSETGRWQINIHRKSGSFKFTDDTVFTVEVTEKNGDTFLSYSNFYLSEPGISCRIVLGNNYASWVMYDVKGKVVKND